MKNTTFDKKQNRKAIAEYKQKQRETFLASLPMSPELFQLLFDFLDEQLEENGCQHRFTLTEAFLEANLVDSTPVLDWMLENGAGCDCEVLCNIEEKFLN